MTGRSERPQSVIGPRVFRAWWRLLRLLLWIIVPGAAVGIALVTGLAGGTVGEMITTAAIGGLNVGVHVAFWTTLAFLVLERSDIGASAVLHGNVDRRSESAPLGARASALIGSVVAALVVAGAALWDLHVGWGAERARVLAPSLWPGVIIALVAVLVVRIVLAFLGFRTGQWTVPHAIVHAILSLGMSTAAIVLLARGRLLHPDLTAAVADAPPQVLTGVGVTLAVVLASIGIASSVNGFRKSVGDRADG